MSSEMDYAWAAGIVDGEGCLFISRHKAQGAKNGIKTDQYFLALKVTMGHEPTILRLRAMFGSGSKHKVEQVGWNPAYTWIVASRLCETVLDKIEPYIFAKAEEVKVAREFLALPGWRNGRCRGAKSEEYQKREFAIWDKMRRLKPRTRYRLEKEENAKDMLRQQKV